MSSRITEKNVMVLPLDKGSGVVILNRKDYVDKLKVVLSDSSKFKVDFQQTDTTEKAEKAVGSSIRKLLEEGYIDSETRDRIHLTDSTTPRMYGLPKTHRELIIDKIGRKGTPFLCVFGRPYIRGVVEPVG